MEALKLAVDNNNTKVITEKPIINNVAEVFNGKTIAILNNDCIVKILSYLDQIKDITNCKRSNKYFCSLIKEIKVLEKLFFSKCCISPKSFLALPCDYLLSVNNQLK